MKYLSEDTITALSTAAGQSAIAVIRVSGNQSFEIVQKLFHPSSNFEKQVKHGYIFDGNDKVDETLCTFFKAPATYTGENLVEISVHGNPVIINKILNILYKNGVRAAAPGEFTYRAFINGKKDLAEAEAVCALITSKTEIAAKAALNNVAGEFSNKVIKIKDSIIDLLAYLEASLDYPEDDIPFMNTEQKQEMIVSAINENKKLLDSYKISKTLQKGLKAAIIGKPNSGKSSLLNAILGKNRAIVTEIAGTTTDTIEETIDCRGIPLTIIDTAGLRSHTNSSIEVLGQERSKEAANKSDILIWTFDSSLELDKNDIIIAQYLNTLCLNSYIIGVLNKCDLPTKINEKDIRDLGNFNIFLNVSTISGLGIAAIMDTIASYAGISDLNNEYLLINSRYFALLTEVQNSIEKAKKIVDSNGEDEIACFEIRNAVTALEDILGINTPHDILDTIFKNFCIGK
ncbi:MAG: tRNA uridine-5-carboxymethylaminomethyl(34) synthesis GTPase MnmE [Endomicrobium sp.]|jgi:tRNA modification GTPase|nr:tRNA uridine-5-carboxymethylaminomethyl(34) synthesis GTPase MnmE [Endomicrobium sp.]